MAVPCLAAVDSPVSRALGIDLGGTNIKAGLVAANGTVLAQAETPTLAHEGPDAIVGRMAQLGRQLLAGAPGPVLGAGVGSPGPLDPSTGTLYFTPNMPGWNDYPLGTRLAERLGMKVVVENDANCAALAEYWLGAGRGTRTMILLTLGTGIGGGIILDGKLVNGARVTAGEVGHIAISWDGPKCGCGSRGCLEAYCGTAGILARARELLDKPGTVSLLRDLAGPDLEKLTPALIGSAARKGDGPALSIFKETGRLLGVGIASLVNLFAPEVVIIGGGIAANADWLFPAVREEIRRRAMRPGSEQVRLVAAELGNHAGIVGAARLVLPA